VKIIILVYWTTADRCYNWKILQYGGFDLELLPWPRVNSDSLHRRWASVPNFMTIIDLYFSTSHNERNELTNEPTNKQTCVITIHPGGGKNMWLLSSVLFNLLGKRVCQLQIILVDPDLQWESKKISPKDLWQFFQNGWEFFNQILHAYYAFLSTLDYVFLFNYLQLWRSYAILHVTCKRDHPVHIMCTKCPPYGRNARWHFLTFSPNSWEFLDKFYTPIKRSYVR